MLAIALGGVVYLLDTESGGSNSLCNTGTENTYISSVKWNKSGKYLAVGTSDAEVQVNTYSCVFLSTNSLFLHSCGM